MPRYTIQSPDGRKITVDAADESTAMQGAQEWASSNPRQAPAQPQLRSNEGLGFMRGLTKPLDNAATWLEGGLEKAGIPTKQINHALGMPSAQEANDGRALYDARQRQRGVVPGELGKFAGGALSTTAATGAAALAGVPLAAGALGSGALGGALLSDRHSAAGVAGDAALGAIGGKVGQKALGAIGTAIAPRIDPTVRYLLDKGVRLTPGMMMGQGGMVGRTARRLENAAASTFGLGDMIKGAQRQAQGDVQLAAVNETVGRLGARLPTGTSPGYDATTKMNQAFADAYDKVLGTVKNLKLDDKIINNVNAYMASVRPTMTDVQAKQLEGLIRTEVVSRFKAGPLDGQAFKAMESGLTKYKNEKFANDPILREGAATVLGEVRSLLARRAPPGAAEQLARINAAYPSKILINKAGASSAAEDGVGTIAGFNQKVVQAAGDTRAATGRGSLQQLSGAAKKVVPSNVPDSGTASRVLMTALMGGGGLTAAGAGAAFPALAAGGAAASLYTKPGAAAARALAQRGIFNLPPTAGAPLRTLVRQQGRIPMIAGGAALAAGADASSEPVTQLSDGSYVTRDGRRIKPRR